MLGYNAQDGFFSFQSAVLQLQPSSNFSAITKSGGIQSYMTYSFEFVVTNQVAPQPSPTTRISGYGIAVLYPFTITGSSLAIDPFKFISAFGSQSSSFPGAENTITITFASNIQINKEMNITITGLGGALSLNPNHQGLQENSVYGWQGRFNDDDKTLVFYSDKTFAPGVNLVVSLKVRNEKFPQLPPDIFIEAYTQNQQAMERRAVDSLPRPILRIDPPEFFQKSIWQSTSNAITRNQIFVTLIPNMDLPQYSEIALSNLKGVLLNSSSVALTVPPSNFSTFLSEAAKWQNDPNHTLRVETISSVPAQSLVDFSFAYYNPSSKQDPPDVSVAVTAASLGPFVLRSTQVSPESNPFEVSARKFLRKDIRQSSTFPGYPNRISFTFSLNFNTSKDSFSLVISNVSGHLQSTNTIQSLIGTTYSLFTDFTVSTIDGTSRIFDGVAKQNGEQFIFASGQEPILAGKVYYLQITIINSQTPNEPPESLYCSIFATNVQLTEVIDMLDVTE
eukprot:750229-Hanusia_phi.AAC.1